MVVSLRDSHWDCYRFGCLRVDRNKGGVIMKEKAKRLFYVCALRVYSRVTRKVPWWALRTVDLDEQYDYSDFIKDMEPVEIAIEGVLWGGQE